MIVSGKLQNKLTVQSVNYTLLEKAELLIKASESCEICGKYEMSKIWLCHALAIMKKVNYNNSLILTQSNN